MMHSKPKSAERMEDTKPGSEPVHVERPHDFGIPPDKTNEVRYVSNAALGQDPGRLQERSNEERDGRRDVGVGVNSGGTGAGSGGDIDTDIVGVGTGGSGISQSPVRKRDELQQHLASGKIEPPASAGTRREGAAPVERTSDLENEGLTGADAIRTSSDDDPFEDAAVGEISSDEANGTDNEEGVDVEGEDRN